MCKLFISRLRCLGYICSFISTTFISFHPSFIKSSLSVWCAVCRYGRHYGCIKRADTKLKLKFLPCQMLKFLPCQMPCIILAEPSSTIVIPSIPCKLHIFLKIRRSFEARYTWGLDT